MAQLKYDDLSVNDRKILLFRVLGVPDEQILKLSNGDVMLNDVLTERINQVITNPNDTTQCAIVCQNIKREGTSYEALDPDQYLEHINELKAHGGSFADDAIVDALSAVADLLSQCEVPNDNNYSNKHSNTGTNPYASSEAAQFTASAAKVAYNRNSVYAKPLVRFFARMLDLSVYMAVLDLFARIFLKTDPLMNSRINMYWLYIVYFVMFAIEPLIIHLCGSTLGKMLFGIKIESESGEKLSVRDAYLRSLRLLRSGFGFVIPFYNLYRMGRSCAECKSGYVLSWDQGIKITHPEKQNAPRIIAYVLVLFLVTAVDMGTKDYFELPPNRGEITEAQFLENIEHIVTYKAMTFSEIPEYTIETSGDRVVAVSFSVEAENEQNIYEYYDEMYLAFLAFAGAQDSFNVLLFKYGSVLNNFNNCFADFSFRFAGLTITNEVEYTGYARNIMYNYLYQTDSSDGHIFTQTFTVSK